MSRAQLGHDARLTLTRYGHVMDELEDTPRIEAEVAIGNARHGAEQSKPRPSQIVVPQSET